MWKFKSLPLILAIQFATVIFATASIADETNLVFICGPTSTDRRVYAYNELNRIRQDPAFDASRPTTIYVHGFLETLDEPGIQAIIKAYITRNAHNLIIYDWSKVAFGEYFMSAVPNVVTLGPIMGNVVLDAIQNGLEVDKFHAVGHSLGGQLCGYLARQVFSASNGAVEVQRVTGLDPAYPGFFPPYARQHLSSSDAALVDIIHTDAGVFGQLGSTGTVDFWPNNGRNVQPGCTMLPGLSDIASHKRSVFYYAESVQSPTSPFLGISASSWMGFMAGAVDSSNVAKMGIDCPSTARGNYYLRTNRVSPYALGSSGMRGY